MLVGPGKASRWQDIHIHLAESGFEVYPPAIKVGECVSKYIVVKNDGTVGLPSFSSDEEYYAVMCYVPQKQYSQLETYVQDVKAAMKKLEPMILPYGMQTPSFFDDTVNAHMTSIQYKNYKKRL